MHPAFSILRIPPILQLSIQLFNAVNSIVQCCQSNASAVFLFHQPNSLAFWESITNWSFPNANVIVPIPEMITNAHIIFEVTQIPPPEHLYSYVTFLASLFEDFKTDSSNKLMFICNFDETRLGDESELEFLTNYVDIHVNTDLRTPFARNIIEEAGEPIQDTTFVLDRNSWKYDPNGNIELFLNFDYYFFEYLGFALMDMETGTDLDTILGRNNINILCRESETRFIDVKSTSMNQNMFVYATTAEELLYECEDYFSSTNVYMVASTSFNASSGLEDLLLEQDLRDLLWGNGYDIQMFFYDEYDTTLPSELNLPLASDTTTPLPVGEYIKDLGRGLPYFENTMLAIVQNFLIADDENTSLLQYDNWDGACNISHKATLGVSVNGWIDSLGGFPSWRIPPV